MKIQPHTSAVATPATTAGMTTVAWADARATAHAAQQHGQTEADDQSGHDRGNAVDGRVVQGVNEAAVAEQRLEVLGADEDRSTGRLPGRQ